MLTQIKRLEKVADLLTKREYENAISRVFTRNREEISRLNATINEAKEMLQKAETCSIKNIMLQVIEVNTYKCQVLKNDRKESKDYLAKDEDEWGDESPIDLREIMRKIFAQA